MSRRTFKPSSRNFKLWYQKEGGAWCLRVGLFLFSLLLATFILIAEKNSSLGAHEFTVGEPAPRTLFSPFSLTFVNEKETETFRQIAEVSTLWVLRRDASLVRKIREKTNLFFRTLVEAPQDETTLLKPEQESLELPFEISKDSFRFLTEEGALESVRENLEILFSKYLTQGVLGNDEKKVLLEKNVLEAVLPLEEGEKKVLLEGIPSVDELKKWALAEAKVIFAKNRREREVTLEIFNSLLTADLSVDESETQRRRVEAREAVQPVEETIKKSELIVQRGMLVTSANKVRLDEIQRAMAKQKVLNKALAVGLLVFLIYLVSLLCLYFFEKKYFYSLRMYFLIHTVFLLSLALCKAVTLWSETSPYLMPVVLAPLLLALLIHARIAILSGAVMAVIAAPLADFRVDVLIAALIASTAGVLASQRLRKRIQFFKVGLAIGMAYFLVIFAFQILEGYDVHEAFLIGLQGFANGMLITTPLAFLLVPLFELCFGLVTDVTLLEISDLNHPLLKRMIVEAPGTYHHSLVVSTLAESACEAIHANALLARVGCYFHDIGKIARAEYFAENETRQAGSRHEPLTATMSSLIIMNHVKDGIELGRRYKLKHPVLQFIPEHQGTGVVYYFYKKALDQAKPGERVPIDDFRYPGPKPQSRETAVALLADSTEATSRSLKNPTPESIRQMVRNIINDKFIDGQLDECNLTLRDLHKIQESFVHNLMAIFHTRVAYPDKPDARDKVDLFKADLPSEYRINP